MSTCTIRLSFTHPNVANLCTLTGTQNTIFWRMLITNSLGYHWLTLYEIRQYFGSWVSCSKPLLVIFQFGRLIQKYGRNIMFYTTDVVSISYEDRALFVTLLTLLLWCLAASGRRSCRHWTVHTARRWRRRARILRSNPLCNRAILVLHNR